MDTLELLNELSKKDKEEIQYALLTLMTSRKIDFITLNNAYVSFLERTKEDSLNQLVEAETCVLESLIYKNNKNESTKNSIQRRLFLLNQSKRFNMAEMNKKLQYDENMGKELSWYYRNKNDERNTKNSL